MGSFRVLKLIGNFGGVGNDWEFWGVGINREFYGVEIDRGF
jgi:hypothetical protein